MTFCSRSLRKSFSSSSGANYWRLAISLCFFLISFPLEELFYASCPLPDDPLPRRLRLFSYVYSYFICFVPFCVWKKDLKIYGCHKIHIWIVITALITKNITKNLISLYLLVFAELFCYRYHWYLCGRNAQWHSGLNGLVFKNIFEYFILS